MARAAADAHLPAAVDCGVFVVALAAVTSEESWGWCQELRPAEWQWGLAAVLLQEACQLRSHGCWQACLLLNLLARAEALECAQLPLGQAALLLLLAAAQAVRLAVQLLGLCLGVCDWAEAVCLARGPLQQVASCWPAVACLLAQRWARSAALLQVWLCCSERGLLGSQDALGPVLCPAAL